MTERELRSLVRALVPPLREVVDRQIEVRLRELGVSHTARDVKPHLRHRGEWSPAERYVEGDGVLHRGCAYRAAIVSSGCEPGDGAVWERL